MIFINSAHVPYGEIKLDGNVHFIGTQGAGKSTLLRSNLFFYNGDKSKLGIKVQAGQKGYDEFYLPYPNSYIIYEIVRETGTFFIMTFLSHGRTAFRIVDCPYDKRFFIDDNGEARHQWGQISEQIGVKVFKSNIIRSYEEYLNILYGNSQSVPKELRRFSLMESAKYRQLTLAIQNIFLNQSLESRVIKDTIINSMDFPSDSINLDRYREEVKNFRQQHEDIWKWYKPEKGGGNNGKMKVRVEADAVIDRFSKYEHERRIISESWGLLNFAMERDMRRLPLLAEEERACNFELSRQRRLLGEENDKFVKERDELKGRDAVIEDFLKKIKAKRQHYERIEIDKIIEQVGREPELLVKRESLTHQEEVLTSKNKDIKTKYDSLIKEIEDELSALRVQYRQQLNEIDRRKLVAEERLQTETNSKADAIRERYELKLAENRRRQGESRQTLGEISLAIQTRAQSNPFKEEMDDQLSRIDALKEKQLELSGRIGVVTQEIDRIVSEVTIARKDLETAAEKKTTGIEYEVKEIETRIAKLSEMKGRQKGSLIQWLGENLKGWEANIGKVVDEEEVLYNTALSPRISENYDSLYGLQIDLSGIDKKVKTPEELIHEMDSLEGEVSNKKKEIAETRHKLEAEIAELERKPSATLKQLRKDKVALETEFNLIPQRIELIDKEKAASQGKLKKWRSEELERLENRRGVVNKEIDGLTAVENDLTRQRDKELETIRKTLEKRKKELAAETKRLKEKEKENIQSKETSASQKTGRLQAEMDAELKGMGVDTDRLSAVRRELEEVGTQLRFVERHRAEYYAWQNDTKEYFNNEQSKKEERRVIKQKIEDLQEKFNSRRLVFNEKIESLSGEQRRLQDEQKTLSEAIARVQAFLVNTSCPTDLRAETRIETLKPLADILENLRDRIANLQQKLDEFKQAVNRFRNNFSPQNTFHFRTEFNTDDDYTEFAAELFDFLSNNKIEQYRTRTSDQYVAIFKRMAKDVADISQHKAEVEKTILSVNRDFRENNFAGVIKEIELRAVESNDRLMQQLLNIKRFDDEHGDELGADNLFSAEDNSQVNRRAVQLLMTLVDMLDAEQKRDRITLADTFKLEFKVKENDNDTNWVEKLSNVGSDGTDILVKAMVNIMLINVFKRKISRKFGDFRLHCMMDEIGKLHPNNVEGILKFANVRNIYLINSSPTTYNAQAYKYTYALEKDADNNTIIKTLLTIK